jgi:chromosome segregation protein
MKASVRLNDLNEEKKNYENAEILPHDVDWLRKRLAEAEKRLIELGQVNMKAIVNYEELKKEVDDIQQKATKLADERLKVLDMIDKIEVKRTEVFNDCFIQINKNFNDMFFKFFNGEAKLSLSNPESPLDSGLIIEAKHKGFNFKGIDSMSGGEKTLTALAFMFAIQFYSPATFYAFDEADAALDKENSLKMGELIKSISKKSQVIAVTHNDTITKLADQMVGVASKNNISVILGLKLNKDQQKDEAEAA